MPTISLTVGKGRTSAEITQDELTRFGDVLPDGMSMVDGIAMAMKKHLGECELASFAEQQNRSVQNMIIEKKKQLKEDLGLG